MARIPFFSAHEKLALLGPGLRSAVGRNLGPDKAAGVGSRHAEFRGRNGQFSRTLRDRLFTVRRYVVSARMENSRGQAIADPAQHFFHPVALRQLSHPERGGGMSSTRFRLIVPL